MSRARQIVGTLIALAIATLDGSARGLAAEEYAPHIDPADFQSVVDNPYYPLVPGTTLKYLEKSEGDTLDNTVTVTHDTKTIMGVKCVVVHDVVKLGDTIKEDTWDWVAQQKDGAVWYFGEDTKEYKPGGVVSTEGSWEAGVNGAQPGILMPAHPAPGEPYRQEYKPDVAEDMGQVIALGESVTVTAGTFADTVRTKEWSMLESGSESKWYARGVGMIKEDAPHGDGVSLVAIVKE